MSEKVRVREEVELGGKQERRHFTNLNSKYNRIKVNHFEFLNALANLASRVQMFVFASSCVCV